MARKDVPYNVEGEIDEATTPVPRYIFAGCNFEIIWEGQFLDYSRVERVSRKRGVFRIKSTRPETVVRRIDLAQVQEINTYDKATVPVSMRLIIEDGKKCIQLKYNNNKRFTIKVDDEEFNTLLYWFFVSIIKHSRYYIFDQAQQTSFQNKLGNMSRQGPARQQSSVTRVNKLVARKQLVDFELVNKTFIKAVEKFEHDNPIDGGPVLPQDRKLNVIRSLDGPGKYSIRGAKGYVARTGGGILAQSSIGMVQAGTLIKGLRGLVTGRNAGSPCVVKMINTAGSSDGAVNAGANSGELNAFIREARILAALGKHENIISLFDVQAGSVKTVIMLEKGDFDVGTLILLESDVPGSPKTLSKQNKQQLFLNPRNILRISREFLKGLSFMHNRRIYHLDIKPANIVVFVRNRSLVGVKLIDFGEARSTATHGISRVYVNIPAAGPSPIGWSEQGTVGYIPPEAWNARQQPSKGIHLFQRDAFAAGLTILELIMAYYPNRQTETAFNGGTPINKASQAGMKKKIEYYESVIAGNMQGIRDDNLYNLAQIAYSMINENQERRILVVDACRMANSRNTAATSGRTPPRRTPRPRSMG